MKKLLSAFIFGIIFAGPAMASDWVPGFEDIPMADAAYAIADGGFSYSVPDGKIISADVASDELSRRQFQRFYRDAMKELGWRRVDDGSKVQIFDRDGDELKIEILGEDPLTARITLTANGNDASDNILDND